MRVGAPVYYDFLPQLEINALVGDAHRFVELSPRGTRLAGGRVYRGYAPGEFAIGKGATVLTFYLFKEDFAEGRKAEVMLTEVPQKAHGIRVAVEQSPGQGFAQVRIDSTTFEAFRRQPVELNWTSMDVVKESQAEVLQSLSGTSGLAYPEVNIAAGHPILWHPRHRGGSLVDQLREYGCTPLVVDGTVAEGGWDVLRTLRGRLSKPENPSYVARRMGLVSSDRGSFRALNSDGTLPSSRGEIAIEAGAEELLNAALKKAGEELDQILSLKNLTQKQVQNVIGDLVGFGTWCFWRCPSSTIEFLLGVYNERRSDPVRPNLLREGVGRVVHTQAQLESYFSAITTKLAGGWVLTSPEFSAIGRVLGGIGEAAELLPPSTADRILQQICKQIGEENGRPRAAAYKRKFKFALLMLAALLRHRRARPAFLDPAYSAAAGVLVSLLGQALERNQEFQAVEERAASRTRGDPRTSHLAAARRLALNVDILRGLLDLVEKQGSDPNIIRKIEEMSED
jgi:hypothetical protein